MAAVYTILLGEGLVEAESALAIYTAPTLGVVVLRDISVCGHLGGSGPVEFVAGGGVVWYPIFKVRTVDAFISYHWDGRQVLAPGEQLRVMALDGAHKFRVTGYLLGV